jgi:predicted secreted protein
VQISLGRSGGSVLWSGPPDHGGAVAFSFTVPSVAPGSYTVVATQTDEDGDPVDGTPASAPLQVTAAASPSASTSPAGNPPGPQGQQSNNPKPANAPPVPHGQPQLASPVTSMPAGPATQGTAPVGGSTPAPPAPVLKAPAPVASSPPERATHLLNPPPQVATMWRVDGAGPSSVPAPPSTLTTVNSAGPGVAPATSTGSREAPSVLTLAALAVLIASAIVVIATTLQLRTEDVPEVAPVRDTPRRQRASRRSATLSSGWSGSPARLR